MHQLLIYCLDETGRVISTERAASTVTKAELRKLAMALLIRCHTVEVWNGAICILRQHADPSAGPEILDPS